MDELERDCPAQVKRYIAENNIKFYTIDGVKIGKEIGLGSENQHCSAVCILQAGQHHPYLTTLSST